MLLPDRESNPGLPRDRRRSSPLDYRGLCHKLVIYLWPVTMFNINDRQFISYKGDISKKKNLPILRAGFEPATYGYLVFTTTVHRSTN